jgi:hypothetical protein
LKVASLQDSEVELNLKRGSLEILVEGKLRPVFLRDR